MLYENAPIHTALAANITHTTTMPAMKYKLPMKSLPRKPGGGGLQRRRCDR